MNESASTDESLSSDAVGSLDVSNGWKYTFRLIEQAEPSAPLQYDKIGDLNFSERRKITFNVPAFLFSSFYYLWKGMYRKGMVILGATWMYISILTFAEGVFSVTLPRVAFYIPASVLAAMLANYDYYQSKMHGKKMWEGIELFKSLRGCIVFAVVGFLMIVLSVVAFPA